MNEAENQVRPNEVEANDENDFTDVEGFDEIANDFNMVDEDESTEEDTSEPETEEVSKPTEPEVEGEVDFTPLLNKLSKDIKYMDEEVNIGNYDEVVEFIQKGKDYDRKTKKLEELENSEEMTYIKTKAKESNMTPTEYIQAIKDYEAEQQKAEDKRYYESLLDKGHDEEEARQLAEDRKIMRETKVELDRIKKEREELKNNEAKNKENSEFISNHPDVNLKDIPQEVYVEAEKIGLEAAYAKHENQKLKEQLKIYEQNKKNKESSPVKGTTEHGGVVIDTLDDFERGFGI